MATYKGIQGYSVQKLSSDPTASEAVGQLWYNSGAGKFKLGVEATGAWASGGAINQGRHLGGGCGTQTAAIIFAGQDPKYAIAETYDGSTWTEVADLTTARSTLGNAGQAPQTTALGFGGIEPALSDKTENYNGTSWTELANLNTAGGYGAGFGTSTAAVYALRNPSSGVTEEWNGTAWTTVTAVPTSYYGARGSGILTAGLIFGGNPTSALTFEYDGTNWTAGGALTTARDNVVGVGTQTDSVAFGGQEPSTSTKTEQYNGTGWTEVADMTQARHSAMPAGTTGGAAIAAGGAPALTATEEWSDPVYTIKTVTVS